jgi:hypothetical protein
MRMVSPGDLTCRRALGDIGQMSGMMAATTQTALPRTGAHDPKSVGHRHRSGVAVLVASPGPSERSGRGAWKRRKGLTLVTPSPEWIG